MRVIIAFLFGLTCTEVLSGCAGPVLNAYTESLGPKVGSIQEREVLANLGNFIDNRWAIPGHVELNAGVIQVQNQVAVGYKLPDLTTVATAAGSTLSSLTHTTTHEFDVNSAQTQDQESYNILPVTDADDLRRLRALYHYAVCPNQKQFETEWLLAAQSFNAPLPSAPPSINAEEKVERIISDYASGKITSGKAADELEGLAKRKPLNPENKKIIDDNLQLVAKDMNTATDKILTALGIKPRQNMFTAAPVKGAAKESGKSGPTSSGSDDFDFEKKKYSVIISDDQGLGTTQWLFWRRPGGEIAAVCDKKHVDPGKEDLTFLGFENGYEIYTDNPKRFSDLVLFVLGGIPNTVGAHIVSQTSAPAANASKAAMAPFALNQTGQFAVRPTGKP